MPNQRRKGVKLAGAFVPDETDEALAELAKKKGFATKADFIRALYDAALEAESNQRPTSKKRGAKPE